MKRLMAVTAGLVAGAALFLCLDVAISSHVVRRSDDLVEWVPAAERPYLQLDHGWFELKRNFRGRDYWGQAVYDVVTDEHGFRADDRAPVKSGVARTIFIGDSFTYGINGPWDQTFAGRYANAASTRVLNAGVPAYSPTPYLHTYERALAEGALAPRHDVILMLDISDVYDEAGLWTDGDAHPHNLREVNNAAVMVAEQRQSADQSVGGRLRDRLRFTRAAYEYIRYSLLKIPNAAPFDQYKSAFTWSDWSTLDSIPGPLGGFAPVGVRAGLDRVREKVKSLVARASEHGGRVFMVVYPWPAQLEHPHHFDWPAFARTLCQEASCAGVVDLFPAFRERATANPHWYDELYVFGDVHFNARGNQLIYEQLLRALPPRAD